MSQALQQLSLFCARRGLLRRLGHVAFRIPGVGRTLRDVSESMVLSERRIWVQIASGMAKGLWVKVLPKWEPGYLRGCAEDGMNEALSRYLKPGDCFYDVGAHIGFYALLAARLIGETGTIIAFEPDIENAETLRQNAPRPRLCGSRRKGLPAR
jgi:hypothetical protein